MTYMDLFKSGQCVCVCQTEKRADIQGHTKQAQIEFVWIRQERERNYAQSYLEGVVAIVVLPGLVQCRVRDSNPHLSAELSAFQFANSVHIVSCVMCGVSVHCGAKDIVYTARRRSDCDDAP